MNLFSAVENSRLDIVKDLLSDGSNINDLDGYGYSALHVASFKGLVEMARYLIDSGIDVNLKDKIGQTILHHTALNNQFEIAEAAIRKGSKLSVEDMHGNQPLWTAVFNDKGRNDRIDIIKLFLENGADPNHKNKVGKSPRDMVELGGYSNLYPLIGG